MEKQIYHLNLNKVKRTTLAHRHYEAIKNNKTLEKY